MRSNKLYDGTLLIEEKILYDAADMCDVNSGFICVVQRSPADKQRRRFFSPYSVHRDSANFTSACVRNLCLSHAQTLAFRVNTAFSHRRRPELLDICTCEQRKKLNISKVLLLTIAFDVRYAC